MVYTGEFKEDDYRIMSCSGVVYDSAEARRQKQQRIDARNGEPFTATTDCPKCGHIAIHWLEKPRRPDRGDNSPVAQAWRKMEDMWAVMGYQWPQLFDPDKTVVARICRECEYRWPQR